jgi:wyosine [tRNA(Phe)-imidazoG37] synthetase (radical SAM superfamily)
MSIERQPYAEKGEILKEVTDYLSKRPKIDFITFSGSGEPTLNSDIGSLIKGIKEVTSIPVVVLTNGTLLFREDVQEDLLEADTVIPSLDAASQAIFERINRPPSEMFAEPLNHNEMIDIKNFFGDGCEVIAEFSKHSAGTFRDVEESIIRMAKRRPVTIVDIANVVGISGTNAEAMIDSV